ncbi:hypothetical protein A4A49_37873 [Nicotiana attenuata]|uniref:DUF1985 domain-containing protein n=1 Tax=Nicotiana attenuata TaxID=49451 RepID=A0A1J6KWB8_NICAT|nr:hypothetical protein A4A49_37873 [Nicotiana attenuata]
MTFKIFDHEVKFTREAFHIIAGLKYSSSVDFTVLHEKEHRLSKVYFPGKDRIELGDLFNFITSHPDGTSESFVCSDDDVVKLATIYFVESVLMGKRKNQNVSEQLMKIVDDNELCSSFSWGSLCYETLVKSLKSCLKPNENENENENEKDKDKDSYTILGFPFAFCVWIMEVYKLIEVVPFVSVEEDAEPVSVHEPLSQDQSSMPSSTQFDEALLKEIVKRLSEKFTKDMHTEVTRINQKIAISETKIQNDIKDLKKDLGSKIDTLLKILVKPDERNIERESTVPSSKDAVDTEPTVPINKDAGDDQCDDTNVHAEDHYESDYRDVHLEDETDIGTEIGKESIDGVEVQDVVKCQDQKNPKETGVTEIICKCGVQSQDLENPLGTSVSEILCKCVEGIYDLSTPLSLKEKFGNQNDANQESFEAVREEDGVDYQERSGGQSQDLENTQGTSISEIICKCIEGTYDLSTPRSLTDNIGSQENASEDNNLTGMILTVAKESCELAIEDHGEQLQDKENEQLQHKENATNMSAQLSVEKVQECSVDNTSIDCVLNIIFIIEIASTFQKLCP